MNLKYDTYIFDYYGTLLDSFNDEHSAQYWKKWLRVLDKKGIKHPDYITFRKDFFEGDRKYRKIIIEKKGYTYPEIDIINVYRDLFESYGNGILDDALLNELAYDFREATRAYIKLFPGVEDYLKKLRYEGKKLYILSNAQRSYTWPEITMFGMEKLVDDVFISSDVEAMKPEKAFYDALFQAHNIDKATAVMIGDSLTSDIAGAIGYGIDYIHLTGDNSAETFYLKELAE